MTWHATLDGADENEAARQPRCAYTAACDVHVVAQATMPQGADALPPKKRKHDDSPLYESGRGAPACRGADLFGIANPALTLDKNASPRQGSLPSLTRDAHRISFVRRVAADLLGLRTRESSAATRSNPTSLPALVK